MVKQVITGKGSVYTYLEDGRTQRYKTATGETSAPQDTLVFIPNYDSIKKKLTENQENMLGENETQYTQTLLSYIHTRGKKIHVINKEGNELKNNLEIMSNEGPTLLAFGKGGGKVDFCIPVSTTPRTDFLTYDTRLYEEHGQKMREKHIGNKITSIIE